MTQRNAFGIRQWTLTDEQLVGFYGLAFSTGAAAAIAGPPTDDALHDAAVEQRAAADARLLWQDVNSTADYRQAVFTALGAVLGEQ